MSLEPFRRGAGLVDRSGRGTLHFTGEQARWFLNQLVTNDVERLEAGQGCDALLLTPNGRITALLRLVFTGKAVFGDVDPEQAPRLAEFFRGRIFATRVEVHDRTEEFGMVTVLGPEVDRVGAAALGGLAAGEPEQDRALGASLPGEDEHATTHFGSAALVRVTRPVRGLDLWLRRADVPRAIEALLAAGAELATAEDHAALCTIEGLPRFPADFDDRFLPQEAALERAVHFAKGCYLGQEAVAMAQRGSVKRRLRHLRFDGAPGLGAVVHEGTEAGTVTGAAAEGGAGWGIGVVKTTVPVGAAVEVAGVRATVLELPGTVEGPKPPSARELRERLQGAPTPPRPARG